MGSCGIVRSRASGPIVTDLFPQLARPAIGPFQERSQIAYPIVRLMCRRVNTYHAVALRLPAIKHAHAHPRAQLANERLVEQPNIEGQWPVAQIGIVSDELDAMIDADR